MKVLVTLLAFALVTWKQLPAAGIAGATGSIVKKDGLFYALMIPIS